MKKIEVLEYATFYKVPKVDGINYLNFRKAFSTTNFHNKTLEPYGYQSYKTHYKCMKIPKGLLIHVLKNCGLIADIKKQPIFPYKPASKFRMKNKPINYIQETVISEIYNNFKQGSQRGIISLKTGKGKTYVATNLIHKLGLKALIMVKTAELRKQWVESFKTHTDCKNIYVIEKSADLVALTESDLLNPDIIISTHKSMSNFIDSCGVKVFSLMLIKLGIGIKVFDEFDLENASMFNLDMNSSTRYTMYLSATDYKSSREENYVFQRIFGSVFNIGKEFNDETKRNGVFYLYNSKPDKKEYASCMQYSPTGWVFSYQKYHSYLAHKFPMGKPLKELWEKFIKKRFKEKLKTVFFIGRKTTAKIFKDKIVKLFGLKDNDVSIWNSDTPKNEIENAKSRLIIISTSNSLGRGVDLKKLDTVIDIETRNSKSATSQVIGRVSRTGMKNVGTYIQFVDNSFVTTKRNYDIKNEKGFFDEFFSNIKEIDNIEDFDIK